MNKYQDSLAKFKSDALVFGVILNAQQEEQFVKYYELLMEWNKFMNLTTITEFDEVCQKHFIDSISLCKVIDCTQRFSVLDIGTGAGFPGIPLKIIFPQLQVTLLDSQKKRINFLKEVISVLELEQIEAIHGRAEDFASPDLFREKYDVCVSRAVAKLPVLAEYCLPFVRIGGLFVAYKSDKAAEEFMAARRAISLLGGELYAQQEFVLPSSDICRTLFVVTKSAPTPEKYPRKAGVPSKEPL